MAADCREVRRRQIDALTADVDAALARPYQALSAPWIHRAARKLREAAKWLDHDDINEAVRLHLVDTEIAAVAYEMARLKAPGSSVGHL